jgi:hypothetical protein
MGLVWAKTVFTFLCTAIMWFATVSALTGLAFGILMIAMSPIISKEL